MLYHVKAMQSLDTVVEMNVDSIDADDARRQVERLGYEVLTLRSKRAGLAAYLKRRTTFPLTLFSQELIALLGAGLSLVEALETLREKERHPDLKQVLEQILTKLREGLTFSSSVEQLSSSFPALYVATVRASERTGDLREALSRYIAYQVQLDQVRKKLVSASIYPIVLLVVGGLVMLFLMMYVVPKFSRIYEDAGKDLPVLSQLLLEWGKVMEAHGLLVMGCLAFVGIASAYGLTLPAVKARVLSQLRSIPAIGSRLQVFDLARFYRTLGMLVKGGIPIVAAIEMVAGILPLSLRGPLHAAVRDLREGKPVSQAMESHGLTTPVAHRMLRVGERTGQMGEMMERIAVFYDEDIARVLDWLTKLIEPALMAAIGLVIGTIVLLMYFPMFELAGSIQ
ncbi:MAG: type II secretion system F family protein [Nitrospira sp.]|jgi:general secretion pathway protein F